MPALDQVLETAGRRDDDVRARSRFACETTGVPP